MNGNPMRKHGEMFRALRGEKIRKKDEERAAVERKKAIILTLGVLCGMVLVYGLDILTVRFPARLKYHFLSNKILRYNVEAEIDNVTVIDRDGRKVSARCRYTEKMQLNYYHYHHGNTGARTVMMERISSEIMPRSITVAHRDVTGELGPRFAARTPPPHYMFLDFEDRGKLNHQRRCVTVWDMIVSTYCVRLLPKGVSRTRDCWSGEVDMGAFTTTYEWRFDRLRSAGRDAEIAHISGAGEFFQEAPTGAKGAALGSYTYTYSLGVGRNQGYVRQARGSFDIRALYPGMGTSYREEFVQKLARVDQVPYCAQEKMRNHIEALRRVLVHEETGDTLAFHNSLCNYLRTYPDSPFWENLLALLNHLRAKCGESPMERDDLLKDSGSRRE